MQESISLTPHIVVGAVKRGGSLPWNMSKASLCYYAFKLYVHFKCWECMKELVKELGDTSACTIAFERFISEGNESALKEMFAKFPEELLKMLQDTPPEKLAPFFDEIFKIAKNEIGERQYLALMLLYGFLNKEEVKQLFKVFAQDWDPKVRRIAINALLKIDEDMADFAKRLLKEEDDPINQSLLRRLLNE